MGSENKKDGDLYVQEIEAFLVGQMVILDKCLVWIIELLEF